MKLFLCLIFTNFLLAQNGQYQNPSDFFKDKTKIKNPFSLRDPFNPPELRKERDASGETEVRQKKDGVFTNIPDQKRTPIAQLVIRGVFIGKDRRAMGSVKGGSNTFVIREGDMLGPEKAEVKAILPGGIVLVEKITNVYGQDEYLETIIPISQ